MKVNILPLEISVELSQLSAAESVPFVFRSVIIIKDILGQQRVQCNQDWEKSFRVILASVFMFIFLRLRLFK